MARTVKIRFFIGQQLARLPVLTWSSTINQYLSAPISNEMLNISSSHTECPNFKPCKYGKCAVARILLLTGTAMVGTINTSIAIFSEWSVIRCRNGRLSSIPPQMQLGEQLLSQSLYI